MRNQIRCGDRDLQRLPAGTLLGAIHADAQVSMTRFMSSYLILSTLVAIFSESATYRFIIDVKLFYLIVIFNVLLMLYLAAIQLNRRLALWIGYMSTVNIVAAFYYQDTERLSFWLPQIIGILICAIYFSSFFALFKRALPLVWEFYLRASCWLCLLGIPLYVLRAYSGDLRYHSVMTEPAQFAAILIPAFSYLYHRRTFERSRFLIVLISLLFAQSLIGYIGILLCIFLNTRKSASRILGSALLILTLATLSYSANNEIARRVNDTVKAFTTLSVTGTNLSTFAFFTNMYVTIQSLREYPLFGVGLGGHVRSIEKHFWNVEGLEFFDYRNQEPLNERDANSLALRLLSEQGILGFSVFLLLLFWGRARLDENDRAISNGILAYFFLALLRGGHYFPPVMYFFFVLYLRMSLGNARTGGV